MKRNIVQIVCVSTLVFGLAATAPAQTRGACAFFDPAGTWGYTHTGTIIFPTGAAVSVAVIGTFTADANGNLSGTQTSSLGGEISKETIKGTGTMNPDCTGTLTAHIYDQSGSLLRSAVWDLVYVDQAREALAIVASLVLPNGASLPAIMTGHAKRMHPGRGNGQ